MLWVFIIYFVVIGALIMGVNFYLFVVYCHAEEKGIGDRFIYKFVVVSILPCFPIHSTNSSALCGFYSNFLFLFQPSLSTPSSTFHPNLLISACFFFVWVLLPSFIWLIRSSEWALLGLLFFSTQWTSPTPSKSNSFLLLTPISNILNGNSDQPLSAST